MTEEEIILKKKRTSNNFRKELKDLLERYNAELDIDIEENDEGVESVQLLCDIHIDDDINAYGVVLAVGNLQYENIAAQDIYLPEEQ